MIVVLYAPYAWLLTIDYLWSSYRWSWIRMWPVLPGLLPASWVTNAEPARWVLAIASVVALVGLMTWLAIRGGRAFYIAIGLLLPASILASFVLYQLFHM